MNLFTCRLILTPTHNITSFRFISHLLVLSLLCGFIAFNMFTMSQNKPKTGDQERTEDEKSGYISTPLQNPTIIIPPRIYFSFRLTFYFFFAFFLCILYETFLLQQKISDLKIPRYGYNL